MINLALLRAAIYTTLNGTPGFSGKVHYADSLYVAALDSSRHWEDAQRIYIGPVTDSLSTATLGGYCSVWFFAWSTNPDSNDANDFAAQINALRLRMQDGQSVPNPGIVTVSRVAHVGVSAPDIIVPAGPARKALFTLTVYLITDAPIDADVDHVTVNAGNYVVAVNLPVTQVGSLNPAWTFGGNFVTAILSITGGSSFTLITCSTGTPGTAGDAFNIPAGDTAIITASGGHVAGATGVCV